MLNTQPAEPISFDYKGTVEVHSIWRTIQGEGPFAGHPAIFIRLAGCNLQCPGCDTEYTKQRRKLNPYQVKLRVNEAGRDKLVVITGGEPFRQNIAPLCKYLVVNRHTVQIETNGTISPCKSVGQGMPWSCITVVCSPKTPKIHPAWEGKIEAYKYVLDADHVDEKDGLPTSVLGMDKPPARPFDDEAPIYLQPADEQDPEKNTRNVDAVVRSCMTHGYIVCLQTQKILGLP